MYNTMKYVVVLVLCLASFGYAKIETEDDVLVITKANFKEALEQHDYILIEFCKFTVPFFSPFLYYQLPYSLTPVCLFGLLVMKVFAIVT